MSSLIAAARAFALSRLRRTNRFTHRPTGYMANGSFHDELLSVHKTQTVSLTNQMTPIFLITPTTCLPMPAKRPNQATLTPLIVADPHPINRARLMALRNPITRCRHAHPTLAAAAAQPQTAVSMAMLTPQAGASKAPAQIKDRPPVNRLLKPAAAIPAVNLTPAAKALHSHRLSLRGTICHTLRQS